MGYFLIPPLQRFDVPFGNLLHAAPLFTSDLQLSGAPWLVLVNIFVGILKGFGVFWFIRPCFVNNRPCWLLLAQFPVVGGRNCFHGNIAAM